MVTRTRLATYLFVLWFGACCCRSTFPVTHTLAEVDRRDQRRYAIPSFYCDALPQEQSWSGTSVEPNVPADKYVDCMPCACNATTRTLLPTGRWEQVNEATLRHLTTVHAVYAVVVVPGFDGAGPVESDRVLHALDLLSHGWVGGILFSGGYRRGGFNESLHMFDLAVRAANQLGIDVANRLLVEPCACHTSTNLRNSLWLIAAAHLTPAILITELQASTGTAQGYVFGHEMDRLSVDDLHCSQFAITELSAPRHPDIAFKETAIFLISPTQFWGRGSILGCDDLSDDLARCEGSRSSHESSCLPMLDGGVACNEPSLKPTIDLSGGAPLERSSPDYTEDPYVGDPRRNCVDLDKREELKPDGTR